MKFSTILLLVVALFIFISILITANFLWQRYLYINNLKKGIHSLNTEYFIKLVQESEPVKQRDLLVFHSAEIKKVGNYWISHNKNKEETIKYFTNFGWEKYAVEDAIIWTLNKAFAIRSAIGEGNKFELNNELNKTIKEGLPEYWKDEYTNVLIEELKIDLKLL